MYRGTPIKEFGKRRPQNPIMCLLHPQAEINIKYKGYIEKEKENVAKLNRLETFKIPEDFDYSKISSISTEARQKMTKVKPVTIAQAGRISGVSPSDINVLLIYLGR